MHSVKQQFIHHKLMDFMIERKRLEKAQHIIKITNKTTIKTNMLKNHKQENADVLLAEKQHIQLENVLTKRNMKTELIQQKHGLNMPKIV